MEAARRIFASETRWTVVRGSDLEEGESQGLPVWSRHVGDPILESNITRRVDFALFMGNVYFDEKINGTIHLALGSGFDSIGGTNESAIHWDIVKDLRSGGRIELDGKTVQENCVWVA